MSRTAALYALILIAAWFLTTDVLRRKHSSAALWVVVLWLALISSRPLSSWLSLGTNVTDLLDAYDEGNPFERFTYLALIAAGLVVLARRGVNTRLLVNANAWLFALCLYWALSVTWSDAPWLALKRWVKDVGNIVMVLVILTERDPVEAMKAVFLRCSGLLVPSSLLFIKFLPELGRGYHVWSGEMMFTGVATHKNSLGALVMVCALVVAWDLAGLLRDSASRWRRLALANGGVLLSMALWLLFISRSATAIACTAIGGVTLLACQSSTVRRRAGVIAGWMLVAGAIAWALDVPSQLSRYVVVELLGRDMTLTTRTEVWPVLIERSTSALLGTGFNSFWSGERLDYLYRSFGIIQAHNGYLETYLNGGVVALILLGGLLLSSVRRSGRELPRGGSVEAVRLAIIIVAICYNFTEAAFNKMNPVWFAVLLAVIRYRSIQPSREKVARPARGRLTRT